MDIPYTLNMKEMEPGKLAKKAAEHYQAREYDSAIKCYSQLILMCLNANIEAQVYNNRGNAYSAKGEDEKAIKDYDKAIELKPDYAEL
ncbi:MAG: tetratricopeptide repeat protein, partial [Candidatus Thiodiazotropha sp.]|nr:tetratricopeptide repeat protein [Candidatus Thiodiazotropha sp.]